MPDPKRGGKPPDPSIEDWEWYGFWRACGEIMRRLPRNPTDAKRALCVQANEWDQMTLLAAFAVVLGPLAAEIDSVRQAQDWYDERGS